MPQRKEHLDLLAFSPSSKPDVPTYHVLRVLTGCPWLIHVSLRRSRQARRQREGGGGEERWGADEFTHTATPQEAEGGNEGLMAPTGFSVTRSALDTECEGSV